MLALMETVPVFVIFVPSAEGRTCATYGLEALEALLVIVHFASAATKIRQAVREADGEERDGDDELRHGCA